MPNEAEGAYVHPEQGALVPWTENPAPSGE